MIKDKRSVIARNKSFLEEKDKKLVRLKAEKDEREKEKQQLLENEIKTIKNNIKKTSAYKSPYSSDLKEKQDKWIKKKQEIQDNELTECSFQPNSCKTDSGWKINTKLQRDVHEEL